MKIIISEKIIREAICFERCKGAFVKQITRNKDQIITNNTFVVSCWDLTPKKEKNI